MTEELLLALKSTATACIESHQPNTWQHTTILELVAEVERLREITKSCSRCAKACLRGGDEG